MVDLRGKKILYIGVKTFNYEKEIKSAMEKMGAEVDYYDERPANDFWTKVFLRLKLKKLIQSKIDSHYSHILDESQNTEYDYVFIIKLETIDKKILTNLKSQQKSATFILYLWDSIQNYKGKEKLLHFFDRAYSFDTKDVEKYSELHFLPLFYIPLYEQASNKNTEIKYDMCFLGTGHSDRYTIVKQIENKAKEMDLTIYKFLYLQSKVIYWIKKLFDTKMKNAQISDFSFTSLNQNEMLEKILQSNVIVDIEHHGQVGLTMRTIESIGCQKKLLTTNKNIVNYDFYNENNICVIDRNNIKLNKDFFEKPYQKLDHNIYNKYALRSWITTIFSETANTTEA